MQRADPLGWLLRTLFTPTKFAWNTNWKMNE